MELAGWRKVYGRSFYKKYLMELPHCPLPVAIAIAIAIAFLPAGLFSPFIAWECCTHLTKYSA